MKVLTLTQPWAQLVADGRKTVETRGWPLAYRGPLAIHAAMGWTKADREMAFEWGYDPFSLPRGDILCVVELVDCIPTEKFMPTAAEYPFGDYSDGRYAWIFDRHKLEVFEEPIPATGAQGIWLFPDERLTRRRIAVPS